MEDRVPRIRLLIVDDHQLIRQALRALLRNAPDIEVVGEARDGQEALALAQQSRPDVVLMDIEMPLMDGVEATGRIIASGCGSRILILTMREEREDLRRALAAGAFGFQIKNSDRSELVEGIRAVARGVRWLSPSIARLLDSRD